mgnify:CR=1 FL=1
MSQKDCDRVVFTISERDKVELKIKLHREGITQAMFFNSIVTAYINNDSTFYEWFRIARDDMNYSKARQALLNKEELTARNNMKKFGFNSNEVENIFDLIAEESE